MEYLGFRNILPPISKCTSFCSHRGSDKSACKHYLGFVHLICIFQRAQRTLSELLAAENKLKLENSRKASSRHSRFGTTISVIRNPNKAQQVNGGTTSTPVSSDASAPKVVLHRQQALNQETGDILDIKKRRQYKKTNKVGELGLQDYLDQEAKTILQGLARTFIEVCFNSE